MDNNNRKKLNIASLILVISIILNIIQYQKDSQYTSQMQVKNNLDLWTISVQSENLVKNLDEFINRLDDIDNGDSNSSKNVYSFWRIALGESVNIKFYLTRVSPQYMGELEGTWDDISYILTRAEQSLFSFNSKFLERGSYSLSSKEVEELKAVAKVYRSIHQGIEGHSDGTAPNLDPELIDTLAKPMMIIDPNFSELQKSRMNY